MFSKVALFTLSAFTLAAVAAPSGISNSCNVGQVQCCNSVQSSDSDLITLLTGLIGVDVSDVTAQVGVKCSPISVIGIAGNSCSAQPACCTGNTFHNLVTLDCNPINANL